jgi:hypothetical protein
MLIGLSPLVARAQADAPAAPPPAPVPAPAVEPKPLTSSEAMPATKTEKADTLPAINVGAWARISARFQGTDPKKLDDQSMDSVYGEIHAGGKIHKNVSVTVNFNASGLGGTAGIMDAIVGFDFADPFHVWVGQLLVPVDRANYAGPFFMIPWNYPTFYDVGNNHVVGAPHEGPSGRNAGAVVWGDFMEGTFKYMVGAFPGTDVTKSPLYSGRLGLAIIGKEPGFWGNATYYGDKDILALGVSGQFQRKGSAGTAATGMPAPVDDYSLISADALAEFKLGGGAWVTLEAAGYHFAGDFNPVKDQFFVMGAIASGPIGYGNLQPMVRYQWAKSKFPVADNTISAIDVGLSYLLKGPALRTMATFQHTDLGFKDALGNDVIGNSVQLSAQAIFF